MVTRAPGPIVRGALRAPASLYDGHLGWILGERFLLLTHVGRRSGRRYRTMLEVIGRDDARGELMVMAGLGRSAQWYRNLKASPASEVAVGRRRFVSTHRELEPHEAAAVLARYERRNRWLAPVLDRVLSALVGWRYDGSEDARRRLVAELPVIALAPVGSPLASTGTAGRSSLAPGKTAYPAESPVA
ncbi:MAG TPA: nitroreductase family deazaflavin-dependent oxidoreductase [Solirubrobacteraceae bacterium]